MSTAQLQIGGRSFTWGAATSAFQIEGARTRDGKGPSIWDRFADIGGFGAAAEKACDHYQRLEEDLDLLADLGVGAYRFSVAWTRLLPEGRGEVNQQGLDFYRRLVDGLTERRIEPWLTLYHWDLPQALQEKGGWANRETVDAFAEYSGLLASSLGDLVSHWITINEPWVAAFLGHLYGVFAPGLTNWNLALRAAHHLLLAHGAATSRIRGATDGSVGIALDCRPVEPLSDDPEDIRAARHFDGFRNRWFFDPIFGKGYPDDMVRAFVGRGRLNDASMSFVQSGDVDRISVPIDFLGLNYYTTVRVGQGGEETDDPAVPSGRPAQTGHTEMGWLIDPKGLRDYLIELHERFEPTSIVITENGASFSDGPDAGGRIADDRRIEYLRLHVDALMAARSRGVPVDGYFVWSLLDNLEWTQGFSQRFGLVWVDHDTQARLPKDSFYWYRDLIRSGLALTSSG